MLTFEEIDRNLVHFYHDDLPEDYVAAAVKIDSQGEAIHAGILVCLQKQYFILHYNSIAVSLSAASLNSWYFHKPLTIITQGEVESFKFHCEKVAQTASPQYGVFFSGSYYDDNGNWYSQTGFPERMTCVGFCISVIIGFIDSQKYIEVADWDSTTVDDDDYFENFLRTYKLDNQGGETIDRSLFRENMRRIRPSEFIATAFFEDLPIRKQQVDAIRQHVENSLIGKVRLFVNGSDTERNPQLSI